VADQNQNLSQDQGVEGVNLFPVVAGFSCGLFAWFFNYAIEKTWYLKWYFNWLNSLPSKIAKPLGLCPFCFGPWLFVIVQTIHSKSFCPIDLIFGIGWAYLACTILERLER
jgi:hypothetical protein